MDRGPQRGGADPALWLRPAHFKRWPDRRRSGQRNETVLRVTGRAARHGLRHCCRSR